MEVDWSGKTMRYTDISTGEIVEVFIFVATLPYSQYSYVELTHDMKMESFLRYHIHMYEYLGRVPIRTAVIAKLKDKSFYSLLELKRAVAKEMDNFDDYFTEFRYAYSRFLAFFNYALPLCHADFGSYFQYILRQENTSILKFSRNSETFGKTLIC